MSVPSGRSSVAVADLDGDGRKDLLVGNTNGQLFFFRNLGTDAAPSFNGSVLIQVGGVPFDLSGSTRSRPFVGDFNGDGVPDILVGAADGLVRLLAGRQQTGGNGSDPRPRRWLVRPHVSGGSATVGR